MNEIKRRILAMFLIFEFFEKMIDSIDETNEIAVIDKAIQNKTEKGAFCTTIL